jgi:type IV pilus assembly protein PilV
MTQPQPSGISNTRSRQAGVSLIEVLVSVFVLAFGILGIAAMQAGALRNNQGSFEQSTAVFITHSMLDAMRASMQPDPDNLGRWIVRQSYATNGNFICTDRTGTDLVANDINRLLRNIRNNLNSGVAGDSTCTQFGVRIACDENPNDPNLCTVSIRWDSSRSLGGDASQVVETRSRL